MKSVASDLLAALGKKASDPEVVRAVAEHALDHVYDDPPLRRYVGSHEQGAALRFNKDRVVDVQIYVQPTKPYHALAGPLPFGLQKGMTRQQVHELLGSPEIDDFDSQYLVRDRNPCLTVVYDKTWVARYLSVALLNGGN